MLGEQGEGWGTGRDSQEWKGTLQGGVGGGGKGNPEGQEPGEVRRGWITPRRGQDRPKPG